MKIFHDRGRTLLPRVDTIFLLSRLMILFGAIWVYFSADLNYTSKLILLSLSGAFVLQLLIFWAIMRDKNPDLKKAYLFMIIFDLVFTSVLINMTGGYQSEYFLFYYLTVAFTGYILAFWAAMTMMAALSLIYVAVCLSGFSTGAIPDIIIRMGIMWFFFLAIAFVSDYIRRSEQRLLNLFNTLNQRTTELEKSQVHLEMIYENLRTLGSFLDVDGIIEEAMRIMGEILAYPASALLLIGPGNNLIYRGRNIAGQSNFHLKAMDKDKNRLLQLVFEQGEPVRVADISGRDDYQPLRKTTHAVMLVPMISHGLAKGVLIAESPDTDAFSNKDEKSMVVVARSAAMALDNAMLHKKMEELTITDELTGIYNYRYFTQKLKEEQRRAARYDLPLSLIMLDIDWFKKFNDTYGHEVGNIVLKGMTSVVKKCIRDVDVFARYGGEEFAILLPQTPKVEAVRIGERIRESVEAATFGGHDNVPDLKVTVSVGASSFPENGKPYDELLSLADQALYRAKGAGKNLVCVI